MTLKLTLGLLTCCVFGGWSIALPVAPAPREKPLLKCEMRLTGKGAAILGGEMYVWDAPGNAEVTITNTSGADVDIGSNSGPDQYLDLRVKDPAGADVKTEPLASLRATHSFFKHTPYTLKPGEVYQCGVGLLHMVPEDKRVNGTYKVQAVYIFKDKEYSSNWIEVKWPFKDGPLKKK
jgi:hypothetical protein